MNEVFINGIYSEELKTAKIIPIYKKGSHDDVNRPISLLSVFSKLLEKILKLRLLKFIKKTFQLDHRQYGFQKGSSTLGATVDLLEYVSGEMDKNKYVITVFVDLQKAINTANIDLLLDQLYKMGCRGICYELLKSYSTNRQ